MAADPDPYYALPMLRGAPAYARPPRIVAESERPFDPDDLPIAAERIDDEPAIAGMPFASGSDFSIGSDVQLAAVSPASPVEVGAATAEFGAAPLEVATSGAATVGVATLTDPAPSASAPGVATLTDPAPSASAPSIGASRFSLRTLTDRLGPRSK